MSIPRCLALTHQDQLVSTTALDFEDDRPGILRESRGLFEAVHAHAVDFGDDVTRLQPAFGRRTALVDALNEQPGRAGILVVRELGSLECRV